MTDMEIMEISRKANYLSGYYGGKFVPSKIKIAAFMGEKKAEKLIEKINKEINLDNKTGYIRTISYKI